MKISANDRTASSLGDTESSHINTDESLLHNGDYLIEFNNREMAIDCPDGFVPEVKSKPSYRVDTLKQQPQQQQQLAAPNKNLIIKPFLNILLKGKSSSKVNNNINNNNNHVEMDTLVTGRQEKVTNVEAGGKINDCFILDGERKASSSSSKSSKSSSSSSSYKHSTIIDGTSSKEETCNLFLSPPSSNSSSSLIKSEFNNHTNTFNNNGTKLNDLSNKQTLNKLESTLRTIEMTNDTSVGHLNEAELDRLIRNLKDDESNYDLINVILKSNNFKDKTNFFKKFANNPNVQFTEEIMLEEFESNKNGAKNVTSHNEINLCINSYLSETTVAPINNGVGKTAPPSSKLNDLLNNLDYTKQSTNSIENNNLNNISSNNRLVTSSSSSPSSASSSSCHAIDDSYQHNKKQNELDEDEDGFTKKPVHEDHDNDTLLTDEGKFLLKKAQYYSVDNLKLVNIEKPDAPLGATIKSRDGSIVISRIVIGGAAQKSGLLHENDEILEINSIPVRGKTINDICDMLYNMQGIISFLIIPSSNCGEMEKMSLDEKLLKVNACANLHLRALFNYSPQDDLYIPCKELGLEFSKGDILHVLSGNDQDWWQAFRDDDKDRSLARLIPSQGFQERRFSQMKAVIGDSFMTRKKREKGFCVRGLHVNRRRRTLFGVNETNLDEIVTYEEVTLYKPPPNKKRPIVLIGPHNIGRHELRKRLMQSNPFLFEVAIPHTTRPARRDEIDGKDYHFLPRHIFEADIKQGRFIEHGEYEKNLYGTSREAIKKVIENSKICVLNLYPQAIKALRCSDLMPYVIYIGPPNLIKLKELKAKTNETYRESDLLDIIDKGREIEEMYGHFFDKIIRNVEIDKTYKELFETIEKVQSEENWVPTSWLMK